MFKPDWNKKYTTIATYVVLTVLACALGIVILSGLITGGLLFDWIKKFFDLISPIIYGFIIAYLLNPVMKFCDRRIFGFVERKKPHRRLRRGLSVALTYVLTLTVLTLFVLMIIPQIVESYNELSTKMNSYIESAQKWADAAVQNFTLFGNFSDFNEFFDKAEIAKSIRNLISDSGSIFETVAGYVLAYAGRFVVEFKNSLLGAIISVYFLISKEKLTAQIKKLLSAVMNPETLRSVLFATRRTNETFGGFIIGKILDSIIIGLLSFVVFGIFDIPFYPLVSLIVGVTNIIPIVGPIIGAIPCAFIIFIAEPAQTLWFVIIVIIIQQIDGNLIGPKILGESTGLSSMWVLIAITVAGGMWGITGMFLGVPIFAVLYSWLKGIVERRLEKKEMPVSTTDYYIGGAGSDFFDDPPDPDSSGEAEGNRIGLLQRIRKTLKELFERLGRRKK